MILLLAHSACSTLTDDAQATNVGGPPTAPSTLQLLNRDCVDLEVWALFINERTPNPSFCDSFMPLGSLPMGATRTYSIPPGTGHARFVFAGPGEDYCTALPRHRIEIGPITKAGDYANTLTKPNSCPFSVGD
jgi:hypothetical protein